MATALRFHHAPQGMNHVGLLVGTGSRHNMGGLRQRAGTGRMRMARRGTGRARGRRGAGRQMVGECSSSSSSSSKGGWKMMGRMLSGSKMFMVRSSSGKGRRWNGVVNSSNNSYCNRRCSIGPLKAGRLRERVTALCRLTSKELDTAKEIITIIVTCTAILAILILIGTATITITIVGRPKGVVLCKHPQVGRSRPPPFSLILTLPIAVELMVEVTMLL